MRPLRQVSQLVRIAHQSVARFLIEATRKRPGAWWRDDFTLRVPTINGLPGVIVQAPEGPVQTAAFEIEDGVIRALYVDGETGSGLGM